MEINNNTNKETPSSQSELESLANNFHTEVLIRKGSNQNAKLKEKFVEHFENFFSGRPFQTNSPSFFDDLFLLRVNHSFLERCMVLTSEEQLFYLKNSFQLLFAKILEFCENPHDLRAQHALEIGTTILKNLFRKKFDHFGLDVATILIPQAHEKQNVDDFFNLLIQRLASLLKRENDKVLSIASSFLFTICTARDNINQNVLLDHFMQKSTVTDQFFESLLFAMTQAKTSEVILNFFNSFCIVTNYKKFESSNPYLSRIARISNGDQLFSIISSWTCQFVKDENCRLAGSSAPVSTMGWLASYIVPSYFTTSVSESSSQIGNDETSINCTVALLVVYEFLYHNKGFMHSLLPMKAVGKQETPDPQVPKKDKNENNSSNNRNATPVPAPIAVLGEPQPSALLVELLSFASRLFSSMTEVRAIFQSKLLVIIFQLLTEDPQVTKVLFDDTVQAKVPIFFKVKNTTEVVSGPLIISLAETIMQYLKNNTKRTMSPDVFSKALAVFFRIVWFEKDMVHTTTRIKWEVFWPCFIQLFRFIGKNSTNQKTEILALASQTVEIVNLFIGFSSELLQGTELYSLCYEITREKDHIRVIYELAKRDQSSSVMMNWVNIIGIIDHFEKALETWRSKNNAEPSKSQVEPIFKESFETFRVSEPSSSSISDYIENPKESSYFRQLLRNSVVDTKLINKLPKFTL